MDMSRRWVFQMDDREAMQLIKLSSVPIRRVPDPEQQTAIILGSGPVDHFWILEILLQNNVIGIYTTYNPYSKSDTKLSPLFLSDPHAFYFLNGERNNTGSGLFHSCRFWNIHLL